MQQTCMRLTRALDPAYELILLKICRWAHVTLRGRDVAGWDRHHGAKFAGPQLTFGSLDSFVA